MKRTLLYAGILSAAFIANNANATVVNNLDASYTADYKWFNSSVGGGTASLEDLTSKGGNLENNAPLPTGAVKLTTGPNNPADLGDKGEISIGGNFGTIGDFINGGTLSYDYYKSSSDVNAAAAASIKLTVLDSNVTTPDATPANPVDGYTTFVFEPYWNINTGVSTNPPTDTWTNIDITGSSGIFWHTGLYNDGNMFGAPGMSFADWLAHFGADLLDADIIGITLGVGSYNLGQTAYFDDVKYTNGQIDLAYDFEVSVVPLPATLPLYGAGLAVLGFIGWRKNRKNMSEV